MTIRAKFACTCPDCGTRIAVDTPIEWERGQKARHADKALCAKLRQQADAVTADEPAVTLDMKPLADFLNAARERGLKFPKARFLAPGGAELKLSVAGETARVPGSITVVIGDEWMGRVRQSGEIEGPLVRNTRLLLTLTVIALDPAKAAKEYGALAGRCSFCDTPITDEGSIEVGYGPRCAERWGLPHKPKGTPKLKEMVA